MVGHYAHQNQKSLIELARNEWVKAFFSSNKRKLTEKVI
jgi:hypothetical protein